MNRNQAINEQINEIMDYFDFDRCQKIYAAIGWTCRGEAVTIDMLKLTARELLETAPLHGSTSTGGLTAIFEETEDDIRLNLFCGVSCRPSAIRLSF